MSTITTRAGKGSPLTNAELDANFTNLNNDKAEKLVSLSAGAGLTGGGDLSANRSFALATSGVTASTYGSSVAIPIITIDQYGRVTSASTASLDLSTKLNLSGGTMTGSLTNNVDVRAPIFYDSNDTGYYIDPNGTSLVNNFVAYRNVATPSNYYNGLQVEVRATSGTAGIGLHRSGYSHCGIYHDEANTLKFNMNNGTVTMNHNAGTLIGSGNFSSYAVPTRGQSNWNDSTVINNAVGMLTWKNYGNGHVIFDASQSTTPSGSACNNTDASVAWSGSYPTLMGWNGASTYGVRVDRARLADNLNSGSGAYATIYYDSNDTARYVDPTSDTHLHEVYSHSWFRSYGLSGMYNQDYGNHWYSADYWTAAGNGSRAYGGIKFLQGHESSLRGYVYWDSSGFGLLNSGGGWAFRAEYGNANNELYNVTWANDIRPYIMYDRNNTGYYCDPTATSNFAGLSVNGRDIGTAPYYAGFQLDANWMPANSTGFTYSVGAPYTGPVVRLGGNSGGAYAMEFNSQYNGELLAHRSHNGDAGSWMSWRNILKEDIWINSKYFASNGDAYFHYIYDSDNSGYYLDINGTSRLGYLRPNYISLVGHQDNGQPRWDFKAYVVESQHHYGHNSTQSMYFGEDNYLYMRTHTEASGSHRAPIFYDSNNTGYYCDPNSTSRFARMLVGDGASAWIDLTEDESPNGIKHLHANSNLVGFVNGGGSWVQYVNESGQIWAANYGWLHDKFQYNCNCNCQCTC